MRDHHEITKEDGIILVKTARNIVKEFLKTSTKPKLEKEIQDKFHFNSGIFVTLNDFNGLRGCIGFPLPDRKMYEVLIDASIAAATEDPRFPSINIEELDSIIFELTILTPPEKITVNKPEEYLSKIKVGRDGLIVRNGFNSGLLLPQVPIEYNWTEKEFLEHICEKAGLPRDNWRDSSTEVQKFEGIIFKEEIPNGKIIQQKL